MSKEKKRAIREYLFQSLTVLASIASVAGLLIAVYPFLFNGNLEISLISSSSLLTRELPNNEKLELKYDNQDVDNILFFKIKIINNSQHPIRKGDYETPINLNIANTDTLISYEVNETIPRNLNPDISIASSNVQVEPLLLNPRDSIIFDAIGIAYENKDIQAPLIDVNARIAGVQEIKLVEPNEGQTQPALGFLTGIVLSALVSLVQPFISKASYLLLKIISGNSSHD